MDSHCVLPSQTINLVNTHLENEDLDRLRPAFYNTSITLLRLHWNRIEGRRGGEVLRDLLVGNDTLRELSCDFGPGPEVAIGFGQGLISDNHGLQKLNLDRCQIGNDFLANLLLLPADNDGMSNNSLLDLSLCENRIEGEDGGRQLCLLLQCFPALKVLNLSYNRLGPLGARALAPGLAAARRLETLDLSYCGLGNVGIANLVPDGQVNRSLTNLDLTANNIQGAEGGRQVSLLLQHFPTLKVLSLTGMDSDNSLGPLGARAMAPGLAAATQLKRLKLYRCWIGNDGVANLVPDGQVNSSLTNLDLRVNNIQGLEGGENVVALLARCTNLDHLDVDKRIFQSRATTACGHAIGPKLPKSPVYRGLDPWWFKLPSLVSFCAESAPS